MVVMTIKKNNNKGKKNHIHNVCLALYFAATLVTWIKNFPKAWLQGKTRPEPLLCNVQYDFDNYFAKYMDALGGFSRTTKDTAYVRGFRFAKDRDGVVRCKISADPGNGKPYLGQDNTPESEGYVILERAPPKNVQLAVVRPEGNVVGERFRKQVLGDRMK